MGEPGTAKAMGRRLWGSASTPPDLRCATSAALHGSLQFAMGMLQQLGHIRHAKGLGPHDTLAEINAMGAGKQCCASYVLCGR